MLKTKQLNACIRFKVVNYINFMKHTSRKKMRTREKEIAIRFNTIYPIWQLSKITYNKVSLLSLFGPYSWVYKSIDLVSKKCLKRGRLSTVRIQ